MADLIIIYDTQREIAAFVNADTQQGWGPAMIGPDAQTILQAFADSTPFDLTLMDSTTARDAFQAFLSAMGVGPLDTPAEADSGEVESASGTGVADAALAEQEARDAGAQPPAPAPADTDTEPGEAPPSQVVECFNCGGNGKIEFGDGTEPQRCNMCQGTGRILQAVTA